MIPYISLLLLAVSSLFTSFTVCLAFLCRPVCSNIQSGKYTFNAIHKYYLIQSRISFTMQCKHKFMIQCKPQNIQFNPIHKIFNSIQSTKYLFNTIHKIFIQSNPQNIQFNPIHKIFIQSNPQNIQFNPIHKIFIQSNPQNIYSIQSTKYLFNLPGASAAGIRCGQLMPEVSLLS